jgi:hypothetical protein
MNQPMGIEIKICGAVFLGMLVGIYILCLEMRARQTRAKDPPRQGAQVPLPVKAAARGEDAQLLVRSLLLEPAIQLLDGRTQLFTLLAKGLVLGAHGFDVDAGGRAHVPFDVVDGVWRALGLLVQANKNCRAGRGANMKKTKQAGVSCVGNGAQKTATASTATRIHHHQTAAAAAAAAAAAVVAAAAAAAVAIIAVAPAVPAAAAPPASTSLARSTWLGSCDSSKQHQASPLDPCVPLVKASITPLFSRYLRNSSFLESGAAGTNERRKLRTGEGPALWGYLAIYIHTGPARAAGFSACRRWCSAAVMGRFYYGRRGSGVEGPHLL